MHCFTKSPLCHHIPSEARTNLSFLSLIEHPLSLLSSRYVKSSLAPVILRFPLLTVTHRHRAPPPCHRIHLLSERREIMPFSFDLVFFALSFDLCDCAILSMKRYCPRFLFDLCDCAILSMTRYCPRFLFDLCACAHDTKRSTLSCACDCNIVPRFESERELFSRAFLSLRLRPSGKSLPGHRHRWQWALEACQEVRCSAVVA